mmetsp:Transcript_29887/g.49304  ORF Transcript_29887/g.49304 Transcript_29887/m.49304 type:complete len:152 (-) Transcript_29887:816-1271(-)|eukprot:CAMPEP_0119008546 /NCGR_PEP_ID=MMETSP1176-20130426/3771_1 /TAXON_ID=265551 /ORGANISM="Synedropsis recta cf, Strain CCMP1620" /LENGTH=151 /DNA_ID=CAMNT_0006960899 /DNA_START=73 /DNA_END=528 /DNA_ORIENTATION=+
MTQTNNIFITWENLAFSLPLLIVCGSYAYFRYIPLEYGLPILAVLGLLFQLRSRVKAHKDQKLEVLDEDLVKELAGDDEEADKLKAQENAVKARKAKNKLEQRLAIEAKQARQNNGTKKKKKKGKNAGDGDDDEDLDTFVKGSRGAAKKTK